MSEIATGTTSTTTHIMEEEKEMRVKKRDGTFQNIAFDKILNRVKNLGKMAAITSINYSSLIIKVIDQLYDGISTTKIDELTAEQCATLSTLHPDYITLASYITVSNNHKNTSDSFYDTMKTLYENKNGKFVQSPLVSHELMKVVTDYKEVFEIKNPADAFLPIQHPSSRFVFAKEDRFFAYPNNFNHYVNYYKNTFQHGGVSLEEIIIPYIVLSAK